MIKYLPPSLPSVIITVAQPKHKKLLIARFASLIDNLFKKKGFKFSVRHVKRTLQYVQYTNEIRLRYFLLTLYLEQAAYSLRPLQLD